MSVVLSILVSYEATREGIWASYKASRERIWQPTGAMSGHTTEQLQEVPAQGQTAWLKCHWSVADVPAHVGDHPWKPLLKG